MTFSRVYRNSSFLLTLFIVFLGFILFARGLSGYLFEAEKLTVFCDVLFAAASFFIAVPVLARLNFSVPLNVSASPLRVLSLGLQVVSMILLLFFVFFFENSNYIGWIQLPSSGAIMFVSLLFVSVMSAFIYLIDITTQALSKNKSLSFFPVILLFAACGIGLSLLVLLSLGLFLESSLFDIALPLSAFLNQLLLTASLAIFLIRLDRGPHSKLGHLIATMLFSILLLLGYRSGLSKESAPLFGFRQFVLSVGLAGFIGLGTYLLLRQWKARGQEYINNSSWVFHLLFLGALALTALSLLGAGGFVAVGLLEKVRLVLMLVVIPLIWIRSLDHKPYYSEVTASISSAFLFCGITVMIFSLAVISPFGASVSAISYQAFKPFFGMTLSGFLFVAISLAMLIWDKVLEELI